MEKMANRFNLFTFKRWQSVGLLSSAEILYWIEQNGYNLNVVKHPLGFDEFDGIIFGTRNAYKSQYSFSALVVHQQNNSSSRLMYPEYDLG